jgi:predicted RNase H-like HicB family nuclease
MPLAYGLIHEEDGVLGISFPDFPGAVATARTADDLICKGTEILSFHVLGMVEDGEAIPVLRDLDDMQRDPEFRETAAGGALVLLPFEMPV